MAASTSMGYEEEQTQVAIYWTYINKRLELWVSRLAYLQVCNYDFVAHTQQLILAWYTPSNVCTRLQVVDWITVRMTNRPGTCCCFCCGCI